MKTSRDFPARRSLLLKIACTTATGVALLFAGGGCDPKDEDNKGGVIDTCAQLADTATAKAFDKIKNCIASYSPSEERTEACAKSDGNAFVCKTCEKRPLTPCNFEGSVSVKAHITAFGVSANAEFVVKVKAKADITASQLADSGYSGPPRTDGGTYVSHYAEVETSFSQATLVGVDGGGRLPIAAGTTIECNIAAASKSFKKEASAVATCGEAAKCTPDSQEPACTGGGEPTTPGGAQTDPGQK